MSLPLLQRIAALCIEIVELERQLTAKKGEQARLLGQVAGLPAPLEVIAPVVVAPVDVAPTRRNVGIKRGDRCEYILGSVSRCLVGHHGDVVPCVFVLVKRDSVPVIHEVGHRSKRFVNFRNLERQVLLVSFDSAELEVALSLVRDSPVVRCQVMSTSARSWR